MFASLIRNQLTAVNVFFDRSGTAFSMAIFVAAACTYRLRYQWEIPFPTFLFSLLRDVLRLSILNNFSGNSFVRPTLCPLYFQLFFFSLEVLFWQVSL